MSVPHGFCELAEQVHAGVDVETAGALGEPVVEALRAGPMLEDEGRTAFVVGEAAGREDPVVAHVLQDLVLALGRPPEGRAVGVGDAGRQAVDADPRPVVVDGDVAGRPVLITRPLQQQLVQPVVAHLPQALRRAMPACSIARVRARASGRSGRVRAGVPALQRVRAATMPGRSPRPAPASRTCTCLQSASGSRRSTFACDRKTCASRNGTCAFCRNAGCRRSSATSFFALRLASSSGLSTVRARPS